MDLKELMKLTNTEGIEGLVGVDDKALEKQTVIETINWLKEVTTSEDSYEVTDMEEIREQFDLVITSLIERGIT